MHHACCERIGLPVGKIVCVEHAPQHGVRLYCVGCTDFNSLPQPDAGSRFRRQFELSAAKARGKGRRGGAGSRAQSVPPSRKRKAYAPDGAPLSKRGHPDAAVLPDTDTDKDASDGKSTADFEDENQSDEDDETIDDSDESEAEGGESDEDMPAALEMDTDSPVSDKGKAGATASKETTQSTSSRSLRSTRNTFVDYYREQHQAPQIGSYEFVDESQRCLR